MARRCRMSRAGGAATDAEWRREGDHLVLLPAGGAPLSLPLGEVGGIAGDGFTIELHSVLGDLKLERLGADGPTLLQELKRDWPPLRAGLLRLTDGQAAPKVFAGQLQGPQASGPFRGIVAEDRFVHVVDGRDVGAAPLCNFASVELDEATFQIRLAGWDGAPGLVLGKLGGETAALAQQLRQARGVLAAEADDSLARHLPGLAGRSALAQRWLPGCLLNLATLESLAPGFETAFRASWLAHCPRAEEGQAFMQGLAPGDIWLGYGRPGRSLAPQGGGGDEAQLLWLLVRGEPHWSLELLSQGDYATYLFNGGDELPTLVAGLIQHPEFSREALYLPLAEMVDGRARHAIAARDLPLLRELRQRFAGRLIHAPRKGGQGGAL